MKVSLVICLVTYFFQVFRIRQTFSVFPYRIFVLVLLIFLKLAIKYLATM